MGCELERENKRFEGGIIAFENERESYIYVCGIRPAREIVVDEHVTLLPVKASAKPDDMVDCFMKYGNGNEFQMGILISTLRMVTAQLRITADDPRELGIRTWNSQSVCLQISALLNCEVAWYFQANHPADKFNSKTRISMICPNMYKAPDDARIINEGQCAYLEKHLPIALNLEDDIRYRNASNALWCHRIHFRPAVQLSVLWGGIESLFMIEKSIKRNLSLAASKFICGDFSMADEIRTLYESRSKAVHELKNGETLAEEESAELLHRLIIECVQRNTLPHVRNLLEI